MSADATIDRFGVCFHGKAWLKYSVFAALGAEAFGWRPFSWTTDPENAQKWYSEDAARAFAERRCIGPFEIAKIGPNQRSVDQIA